MKYMQDPKNRKILRDQSKVLEIHKKITVLHEEINKYLKLPEEASEVHQPEEVFDLMKPIVSQLQEELWVLSLNTRNKILSMDKLYMGSLNSSVVRIAEVMRLPIIHNASTIIIVHNHPSGDPRPSSEDITLTRAIVQAGKLLEIELLDHVIVGNSFVSLKKQQLGF